MRSFAFLLSVQAGLCAGFSPAKTASQQHHHRVSAASSSSSALRVVPNDDNDAWEADLRRKAAGIAATLALGWTVGVGSGVAAPQTTTSTATFGDESTFVGSSFVVALSNSDFADFSLPSYEDVSAAEINTNLNGGKLLGAFGKEAAAAAASSSSDGAAASAAPVAEEKKEPSAADVKAQKAAAKAEAQAARARQQAAVEAAAASKQ